MQLLPMNLGYNNQDPSNNTATAIIRLKNCSFMLSSVYLPPNDDYTKLATMNHLAKTYSQVRCPWAVFGDFNMTPNELVDMQWSLVARGTIHCADVTKTVNQPNGRFIDYAVMDQRVQNMILKIVVQVAETKLDTNLLQPLEHDAVQSG